jgi:hypothetical protein
MHGRIGSGPPLDYARGLLGQLVVFRVVVERIDAAFKLSQKQTRRPESGSLPPSPVSLSAAAVTSPLRSIVMRRREELTLQDRLALWNYENRHRSNTLDPSSAWRTQSVNSNHLTIVSSDGGVMAHRLHTGN